MSFGSNLSGGNSQRGVVSQNGNISAASATSEQNLQPRKEITGSRDATGTGNDSGITLAATGVGETRVCLGIIPVKVQGNGKTHVIATYALPDNGAKVTLCHELLANTVFIQLNADLSPEKGQKHIYAQEHQLYYYYNNTHEKISPF